MTVGSPLRVAVATPSYPPELGGLGTHVQCLAAALADEGCQTTVLTQVRGERPPTVQRCPRGATLRVLGFRARVGGRRFSYAPSLRRYAHRRAREFDVVHAFSYHAPVALAVSGASGPRFFFSPVFHSSGHSRLAQAAHVAYQPMARRTFDRADAVLCSSDAERHDVVERYPFCAEWARVIPIAVDADRYDGVEPFVVDRPVILSAGRLDRYKRVDTVIGAMAALHADATLVVCGAGPDASRLRHLAETRGVAGRVRFAGAVPDAEIRRWQRTATVTVSLSERESFGLALAEAVVAGSRVVASDIPAHREMAAAMGASPAFVPCDATPDEVAVTLGEALAAGRPTSRDTTSRGWADVARETIAAYEDALSRPRRGR